MAQGTISYGTLGSAATFAGEAARHYRKLHPEYAEPIYFPSMEACWDGLDQGKVEVLFLGIERTGQPHTGQEIIERGYDVIGWTALPLQCNLYVKPGTKQSDIKEITGHGSIYQCLAYLDKEFPGIPRAAHGLNSVEGARAVMAANGTMAVVGSRSLPEMVPGLETLATGIDAGAVSSWWAMTKKRQPVERPDTLVVTLRCGPDGTLGRLTESLSKADFRLRTAASFAVNHGCSVYDYLLTFSGAGTLAAVKDAVSPFTDARLAGAFNEDR